MNDRNARTNAAVAAALISLSLALPAAAAPAAKRPDPYAAGMRQVREYIAAGDLDRAERTTAALAGRYRNNPEILAVRGRVLFWKKRYADAIACFEKAQRLRPDAGVAAELDRVRVARQMAEADRLAERNEDAAAEQIVLGLFEAGKDRYGSGVRLARLKLKRGEYRGAADLLTGLLERYPNERDFLPMKAQALLAAGAPDEALAFLEGRPESGSDAILLALRGRALMRLGRFDKAADSYRASLALAEDAGVRGELDRADEALLLEKADRLAAAGDTGGAIALLRGPFEGGRDRYGTGTRLAALYAKSGKADEAARVYLLLMGSYPKDGDFPILYAQALVNAGRNEQALKLLDSLPPDRDPARAALRGRILAMKGDHLAASREYEKARDLAAAPGLATQRQEAQAALDYQRALAFVEAKEYDRALPLLDRLAAGGPYAREARLLEVKALLARRDWDAAAARAGALYREEPQDTEPAALYAEALLRSGDPTGAREVLDRLDAGKREALFKEREDLFYAVRGNWAELFGGLYHYGSGYGNENVAGVAVSRRFRPLTALFTLSETTRFKKTDPQLAVELYQARKAGSRAYGSVNFSLAPGADVLPRYTAGAEGTWVAAPVELSLAWNWLKFKDTPTDASFRLFGGTNVFSAAATWYLPGVPVSLAERVYHAPENSTFFSVTTVRFNPTNRMGVFAAAGVGNSSERVAMALRPEDLQRYTTWSFRSGGEYRLSPSYSVGGEASFESRRGLYDRYGATAFVKYWWP